MRRSVVAGVLFFTLVPLGACAATPSKLEIQQMSPDEAKQRVLEYYADVLGALGADQWTEMNSWGPCQLDGRSDEVQWTFSAQRFAQLAEPPGLVGDSIASDWRERGLNPSAASNHAPTDDVFLVSDPPSLSGLRADGGFTQISLDPRSALFRAKSACVPGRLEDMDPPEG